MAVPVLPALDGCNADGDSRTTTSFDAAGHADEVTASDGRDVDYLYDADGSVIAQTKTKEDGSANTTYFFYFGLTRRLAEETTPQGRTKVRYFVNSTGEALAQERYDITRVDAVDDADPGTWTWLLKDPHGSVGTHVKSDGTVTKQTSMTPTVRQIPAAPRGVRSRRWASSPTTPTTPPASCF